MARLSASARLSLAISCAAISLAGAVPALAGARDMDARDAFMQVGKRVAPPRGYIDFCVREPVECPASMRARGADDYRGRMSHYWRVVFEAYEPAALPREAELRLSEHVGLSDPGASSAPAEGAHGAPLHVSDALWRDLTEVNQSINGRISAASDARTYGRSDYWALPLAHHSADGDCEDYVLEKRRALRELGYAENLLSIALVTTSWGEKHAVLLVQTDAGEVVLDSLSSRISYWRDAPYRWESRQSPENPAIWVAGPDHKKKRKAERL